MPPENNQSGEPWHLADIIIAAFVAYCLSGIAYSAYTAITTHLDLSP